MKLTQLKSKSVYSALPCIARIVGITGPLMLAGCTVFDTNWISAFFPQNTAPIQQAIYVDTKTGTVKTVILPAKTKSAPIEDKQILDIPSEVASRIEPVSDIKKPSKEKIAEITPASPTPVTSKKAAPITKIESTPIKPQAGKSPTRVHSAGKPTKLPPSNATQQCCKNTSVKDTGVWTANPRAHNTLRKLLFAWSLDAGYKLHWGEGNLNNTDFAYTTPFKLNGDFQTVVKQLLASRNLDPQLVPHFYIANRQLVIRPGKGAEN